MLIPSLYTSASTAPFPRSVRDGNSILFGTPVKQFISKTRASWTAGQTAFFREWIETKGQANFRTCDLNPLFKRLEIDGYRGVTNALGEDIEQLLIKKVKAKLTAENKGKKDGKMGYVLQKMRPLLENQMFRLGIWLATWLANWLVRMMVANYY